MAILNIARDINERQRQGEEIREANRQLSLLNAIGLGLTGASDAATVLSEVHEHLKDAIGYTSFDVSQVRRVARHADEACIAKAMHAASTRGMQRVTPQ